MHLSQAEISRSKQDLGPADLQLTALAVSLIENLNSNDGSGTGINAPGDSKAMGFAMPSGADYILDSVILRLAFSESDPIVQIWSNTAANQPGAPLTTLVDPVITFGINNFTFTPGGSFTLLADTIYWLVVGSEAPETGNENFFWYANSPSITPTGIASHFGQRFGENGPPPTGSSTIMNSYQINATAVDAAAVPEPGTMALLAFGLPALAMARRRGRRR